MSISSVGKYTYGHQNIKTYSWGEGSTVHIGAFSSIATNIQIFLGGNHRTDWVSMWPFGAFNLDVFSSLNGIQKLPYEAAPGQPYSNGDVFIGNDVWIGANATIMSGLTIGDGAVIANNSHVVKDVEPFAIVGGNPAKTIRKRFDEETIEKLLKLKWWEFDDIEINRIAPILSSNNIDKLFEIYKERL